MKSLLSYSTKHWTPESSRLFGHTIAREAEIWYQVLKELGEVDYIDSTDKTVTGREYDFLVSLPNNFAFLKANNKFRKTVVSLNVPEPNHFGAVMQEDASKIGCKLSDCFRPRGYADADKLVLLGGDYNWQKYEAAGYDMSKFVPIKYGMDDFIFVPRHKNKKTIFLHVATTLGLRKGFWHIVNDFKKADLDAELWCIGEVQRKEQFWSDFAREAEKDPRIKIFGWVDCFEPKYKEIMSMSDYIVFASWGEGQPGTVMEALACGCLPFVSRESGTPFHRFGKYIRGEVYGWRKLHTMESQDFQGQQQFIQKYLKKNDYTYESYKNTARQTLQSLL